MSIPNALIIRNQRIHAGHGVIEKGFIKIVDGVISEVGDMNDLQHDEDFRDITLPQNAIVIPGMIDVHIHGVNGADTMDATKEALDTIVSTLPREGTTSFLATTITESTEKIEAALASTGTYIEENQKAGKAEILGIHLEGPFINSGKAGAQPINHIARPSVELFGQWQKTSRNHIKLVTLAPEMDKGHELIGHLQRDGIVASAGHSNATYDEMCNAIHHGLTHVTHVFNQMSGFHHREPGVVGAAFNRDELMVELISDGIHVRPEVVKIAFQQITDERMILITDSMRAKCLKNGQYDLGGQTVTVKDGKALLDEDTLAGSVLKMDAAFRNIQEYSGCSFQEAVKITSENPARQLGVFDRKGSIDRNKDADLVILDDKLEVYMTICKGQIAYVREEGDK
ncbi:N-acetylglucosamine-6-phosphate deacetylase [Rossellomorea aquimaris]|uniref:N-acetylglucosamine-6-phosphate deacetylase n=1 Tax=Rossellomorea aquimaris TaxID=189382 RepID=UPI001CD6E09D|nr:N-acetylglucosamine-6-phosphate deacetylase [Rossellomorea aquimaris]MCA1055664.1 N-acetylglucosamine-6-phosphate deacetylase [Rossellomorea aquimaris]